MSAYEVPEGFRLEEFPIGRLMIVIVCNECDSLVWSVEKHKDFHDALRRTAQTAAEADHWAGMNRPIGGSGTGGNEDSVVWFPQHRPFEDL